MKILLLTVCLISITGSLWADNIRAVGVLGNSGKSGSSLIRTTRHPDNEKNSGAAVAHDMTLWVSGGDSINQLSLSGQLLERFPLVPRGSMVNSKTFAVLDDTLYFSGETPDKGISLFALSMKERGATAEPLSVALPSAQKRFAISPQPLNGRLLLAVESEQDDGMIDFFHLDVRAKAFEKAFSIQGREPNGVAVDSKTGIIYLGALLLPQDSYMITALRPDGKLASPAFPIPCMKTPAIPTQFKGIISFAGEAIWDCAWYGFMSRHFTDGQNAPGRIIEWHHELDYPTQVVALATGNPRYDALLITCPTPNCFYFAHWDKQRQKLDLTRRFGCLPDIYSLGLSEDGYITAGTARTQLWWRWEDGPDSPCRKADIHIAVTPPYFRNESCLAVGAQYELSGKHPLTLAIFRRTPGDRNEASRVVWQIPIRKPVGQSVRETPGSDNGVLFLTDADQKQIWAIDLWLPQLRPNADTWRTLTIEGATLTAPTDIVALTDGRLLLADAGRILMLEPRGEGYTLSWEFSQWGEQPDQHFGKRLRIAADGTRMLVSDTERHRIVYLDWQQRKVIAQFGETDNAGDDLSHVNQPTLLSLRASRAVVADSGNQRIVKLVID